MSDPKTIQEALALIAAAPKGAPRKELVDKYRNLVGITGGGSILYATTPVTGKNIQERLGKTYIGVLERLNARTGIPDGLGTFGGLGEYATEQMLEKDGASLGSSYDNVVWDLKTNTAKIITDINTIARNNAAREAKEELQNLGITDYEIPKDALELIDMPGVTDDNFIVNRWNGEGVAYGVTPYGHLLKVEEKLLDRLQTLSHTNMHEENSEAKSYQKMPLFEALKHWGKKLPSGAVNRSEDGRDLTYDYRYPHEYILTWVIASKVLNGNEQAMLQLANEVQSQTPHLIDFKSMALQMGISLENTGKIMRVSTQNIQKMSQNMTAIYLASRQKANGRNF